MIVCFGGFPKQKNLHFIPGLSWKPDSKDCRMRNVQLGTLKGTMKMGGKISALTWSIRGQENDARFGFKVKVKPSQECAMALVPYYAQDGGQSIFRGHCHKDKTAQNSVDSMAAAQRLQANLQQLAKPPAAAVRSLRDSLMLSAVANVARSGGGGIKRRPGGGLPQSVWWVGMFLIVTSKRKTSGIPAEDITAPETHAVKRAFLESDLVKQTMAADSVPRWGNLLLNLDRLH